MGRDFAKAFDTKAPHRQARFKYEQTRYCYSFNTVSKQWSYEKVLITYLKKYNNDR